MITCQFCGTDHLRFACPLRGLPKAVVAKYANYTCGICDTKILHTLSEKDPLGPRAGERIVEFGDMEYVHVACVIDSLRQHMFVMEYDPDVRARMTCTGTPLSIKDTCFKLIFGPASNKPVRAHAPYCACPHSLNDCGPTAQFVVVPSGPGTGKSALLVLIAKHAGPKNSMNVTHNSNAAKDAWGRSNSWQAVPLARLCGRACTHVAVRRSGASRARSHQLRDAELARHAYAGQVRAPPSLPLPRVLPHTHSPPRLSHFPSMMALSFVITRPPHAGGRCRTFAFCVSATSIPRRKRRRTCSSDCTTTRP